MIVAFISNVLNFQRKTPSLSRCGLCSAGRNYGEEPEGKFQKLQTVWKQNGVVLNKKFCEKAMLTRHGKW